MKGVFLFGGRYIAQMNGVLFTIGTTTTTTSTNNKRAQEWAAGCECVVLVDAACTSEERCAVLCSLFSSLGCPSHTTHPNGGMEFMDKKPFFIFLLLFSSSLFSPAQPN